MKKTPKGYEFNTETGEIYRHGELVATVNGDEITYASDEMRKYAPPVATILANRKVETIASISQSEPVTETTNSSPEPVVVEPEPEPEPIPPCPESDPRLGPKTHAIVDWYRKYHPEEFHKKYLGQHIYLGILQEDGTFKEVPTKRRRRGGIPIGNL